MAIDRDSALRTADILLQIKAIRLRPDEPFVWASGWRSPIYCDNRIILSHPEQRAQIRDLLVGAIQREYAEVEVIAGVATGAVAIGALVADKMGLPFVYVRPEAKEHGRKNQVEGELSSGMRTVVIEDLVSTGNSSLRAVAALREADAEVLGMAAIFTYGFPQADRAFDLANCALTSLSDYDHLLRQAASIGFVKDADLRLLESWRQAPAEWGGVPPHIPNE